MYKSILVPLDGSMLAEEILPEIEKVALAFKARIVLVRVSKAHTFPGADPTEAQVQAVRKSQAYLNKLKQNLTVKGFEVEDHTPYGDSAEKILEVCRRRNVDLIAMSTHGRSGLGRLLLGSVAEKVLRGGTTPVLLIRPPKGSEA